MKRTPALLTALALLTVPSIRAQQPDTKETAKASVQELTQRLFDPQGTQEQLLEALKAAGPAGIARQQMIEAKVIWGLRHQDAAFLSKLLPELQVLAENFDPAQSAGIKSSDDIRAFIAYTQALQADAAGDEAAFKTNILEAIWKSPGQAPLFLQLIEKKRTSAKMASIKIDLQQVVTNHEGEATTLQQVLDGKKALLIDFWASWCGPCMKLMPELKKKAGELSKHGIVVAGMNKDDENAEAVSAKIREEKEIDFPWLIEPKERPFTKLLEIETIPRMILISPEGQVLFNGHPQDPSLWVALQKIDSTIKAPAAE